MRECHPPSPTVPEGRAESSRDRSGSAPAAGQLPESSRACAHVQMRPDHARVPENHGNAHEVNPYYAHDDETDSDQAHEKLLCEQGEDPQIRDTEHPTDVHRTLKKTLLTLEAMPAHRTRVVHAERPGEHAAPQADGTALREYRSETR